MNVIITSEMRVGSRWVHYLLRDLTGYGTSPEMGDREGKKMPVFLKRLMGFFHKQKIPKFHHATQYQILRNFKKHDYKIIGIVRNPWDRITSLTFHQRNKPEGKGLEIIKGAINDVEAVRECYDYEDFRLDDERQLILMTPRCSTYAFRNKVENPFDGKYIWTSYEWLINDTFREIKTILDFLGIKKKEDFIKEEIRKNSFRNKSGREPGQENRKDEWRRKGVTNDWMNWFTPKMCREGKEMQETYYMLLKGEEIFDASKTHTE